MYGPTVATDSIAWNATWLPSDWWIEIDMDTNSSSYDMHIYITAWIELK